MFTPLQKKILHTHKKQTQIRNNIKTKISHVPSYKLHSKIQADKQWQKKSGMGQ